MVASTICSALLYGLSHNCQMNVLVKVVPLTLPFLDS